MQNSLFQAFWAAFDGHEKMQIWYAVDLSVSIFFVFLITSGVFVDLYELFIAISLVSGIFGLHEYGMENLDEKVFGEELDIKMFIRYVIAHRRSEKWVNYHH